MGPILVNTKQKIAVLAAGLAVATSGFVIDEKAAVNAPTANVGLSLQHEPSAAQADSGVRRSE
jgi:hypothetical protein